MPATGLLVGRFDGTVTNVLYASVVSGAGDLDGDGLAEVMVGAPMNLGTLGSAFVHALDPYLHADRDTLSRLSDATRRLWPPFKQRVIADGKASSYRVWAVQI